MLSRQDLTRRKLGSALEKLVTDSSFLANMQRLRDLQDNVDGARNAAREIIRFLAGDD
jgi:UDP:flavonoid glycosyltransferase YjiC (YdhE family)